MYKANTPTKEQQKARRYAVLTNHIKELQAMGYKYETLKPIRTLENKAHRLCELSCNGEIDEQVFEKQIAEIGYKVRQLFTQNINEYGFFINQDPRGYALKLESGAGKLSFTDWGRYEILAPEYSNM